MNISEISALNFINIGLEMSSGDVFEKNMVLYEIYKKKTKTFGQGVHVT